MIGPLFIYNPYSADPDHCRSFKIRRKFNARMPETDDNCPQMANSISSATLICIKFVLPNVYNRTKQFVPPLRK